MKRLRRPLSSEERRLWAEIARSVHPLPGRPLPDPGPDPGPPGAPAPASTAGVRNPAPPGKPAGRTAPRPPPALAPLDRKTARALSRGRRKAEGTLDLHGLSQAEAHRALLGFLRRAQAGGHGLVLVVTGRGGPGGETGGRGVLRRQVPQWLARPEMRALVLGFEEAGPRQGGSGALHVRLRRPREPGRGA